jgi:hypothetical protein
MENNQRALDWLEDNLIGNPHSEEDFKHNIMIWGQAKQMEKEQMAEKYDEGHADGYYSGCQDFEEYKQQDNAK